MDNIKDCKILLVDDEAMLLDMVQNILIEEGYKYIYTASSCKTARLQFEHVSPDLAILDVNLPDGDGFSLMQEFRQVSSIPMLFLSARDEDESRLLGLGLGADDYITKPFLPRELILRLSIILKRTYFPISPKPQAKPVFKLGDRSIDLNSGTVNFQGQTLTLTAKEFALLEKLYDNKNRIVTIDALCEAAWGDLLIGYENTLMVHIRRLRSKIESDPSHPQYLQTVRGLGYKLVIS